jgi:hypothetical protein
MTDRAGVAQSVQCLTADWTIEVRSPAEAIFPLTSVSRPGVGPTQLPIQCVPFPTGKARPGRDADRFPPSGAKVKNV